MKNWNYDNDQWRSLPTHLKHLPIFTRQFDLTSYVIGFLWFLILKFLFNSYIRLNTIGSFKEVYKKHPKLLLISNHSSHLDATSIAAAVPFRFWRNLYISAAKDYWFRNPIFTFFSKHCLGAIPIDRKDKPSDSIKLCINLLNNLNRIWLILFPEGTRSPDGYIQTFKKGVSVFATATDTPVLFLYIQGNKDLWPKGRLLPYPGSLKIHIGPVHPPAEVQIIEKAYKEWLLTVDEDVVSK